MPSFFLCSRWPYLDLRFPWRWGWSLWRCFCLLNLGETSPGRVFLFFSFLSLLLSSFFHPFPTKPEKTPPSLPSSLSLDSSLLLHQQHGRLPGLPWDLVCLICVLLVLLLLQLRFLSIYYVVCYLFLLFYLFFGI